MENVQQHFVRGWEPDPTEDRDKRVSPAQQNIPLTAKVTTCQRRTASTSVGWFRFVARVNDGTTTIQRVFGAVWSCCHEVSLTASCKGFQLELPV